MISTRQQIGSSLDCAGEETSGGKPLFNSDWAVTRGIGGSFHLVVRRELWEGSRNGPMETGAVLCLGV